MMTVMILCKYLEALMTLKLLLLEEMIIELTFALCITMKQ